LTVYADTSFFVSIYIKDSHSKTADQLLGSGGRPWFTPLHSAEWSHAVAQQVFWGAMSAADAQQVYRDLANDLAAGLWVEIELPEKSFDLCADLARVTAQNSAFTPSTACTSPALSNSKLNDFGPSMIARRSWQRRKG
jgi:hypothetical protein